MASCSEAEDYVAGKLSAGDVRAFESHAATCASCGKALVRRKAVERAASVMKRNQVARDSRIDMVAPSAEVPASKAVTVEAPVLAPQADWTAEPSLAGNPNGKRIAFGIAGALTVGVAIWIWAKSGTSHAPPQDAPPPVAAAPLPKPEPAVEQPPPPAPEPTPPPPVEVVKPPEPPHPVAEAPAKAPTPAKAEAKQKDWLPIGTDIEELAETVAGKKCGAAVTALRDRVVKHKEEARSWALLTTCYAKRKRWQNALDAFDMVVQYGDQALVASVQSHADASRAGLQAEAEAAAATPAPEPPQ